MFRKETYVRRRSELRKRIEGGLVLLPGNGESPANYPSNQFRFRQDSTFLYFFGLNRPDYVGLMDIDSGEETLYGDDYTIDDIIWMGPQPTLDEQAREVGIGKTLPLSQLGKRIEKHSRPPTCRSGSKRPSPRGARSISCLLTGAKRRCRSPGCSVSRPSGFRFTPRSSWPRRS